MSHGPPQVHGRELGQGDRGGVRLQRREGARSRHQLVAHRAPVDVADGLIDHDEICAARRSDQPLGARFVLERPSPGRPTRCRRGCPGREAHGCKGIDLERRYHGAVDRHVEADVEEMLVVQPVQARQATTAQSRPAPLVPSEHDMGTMTPVSLTSNAMVPSVCKYQKKP